MLGEIFLFKEVGFEFLFRWAHVVVGITWIGLLYFFNFVQVPAYAEMEVAARNDALDKVTWRALWWFRWAALMTFLSGCVLILLVNDTYGPGFFKSAHGAAISIGMLYGTVMFLNVWGVIWRAQKVVIGNARNVAAGGAANPAAADAGRSALMVSRVNTVFSLALLLFMVGAPHLYGVFGSGEVASGKRMAFMTISALIILVLELAALGVLPGKKTPGRGLNWMFDTHRNAIVAAVVLVVVSAALAEVLLLQS